MRRPRWSAWRGRRRANARGLISPWSISRARTRRPRSCCRMPPRRSASLRSGMARTSLHRSAPCSPPPPAQLREGRAWIIAGGHGGVGGAVAAHLMARERAKDRPPWAGARPARWRRRSVPCAPGAGRLAISRPTSWTRGRFGRRSRAPSTCSAPSPASPTPPWCWPTGRSAAWTRDGSRPPSRRRHKARSISTRRRAISRSRRSSSSPRCSPFVAMLGRRTIWPAAPSRRPMRGISPPAACRRR